MRKHAFRSIFSLLVALMMVCSLLPTAAFAEGNLEPVDQVTEQPTNQPAGGEVQQPTEKKEDAPQGEQPATPPQTYTVVYADGAENTVFDARNFPNLTSGASTPAFGDNPVRDGYTFRGWEPALAETVTGDVTYTAKWQEVQMEPLPATNDSYGIAAYKGGHDTPQPSVAFDAEKNLGSGRNSMWVYVIYHANYPGAPDNSTWTVRYNIRPNGVYTMSGGDFLSYSQCGGNGKGFNCAGYKSNDVWYSDKNCTTVVNSLKVKKDAIIDLYAGWTKSAPTTCNYSLTLNYDVNGGGESSKPASQSHTAESSTEASLSHTFTISSTVPTREGYTFKGWSDTAGGGVNYTAGGSYTMNATKDSPNPAATLYAVWEEITYTVTYTDGVDGEEIFDDVVYHNLKAGDSTPTFNGTPIRKGYTFAGWNPEVAPTVTGDRIYTATWEPALPGAIFGSFIMKCVTTPKPSHYLIERADIELAPLNAYTNSGVQKGESGDTPTYYFELTVDAEKYLSQYDTKAAPTVGDPIAHTICDGQQTHPVIRYDWNGTAWVQVNKPVVEVNCAVTFTVTYTDGVDGEEVFANQSYTVEPGKPTPAFSGTPTRSGYTFAGWEPTVAETVTENATYTALWMRNPAKPEGEDIPEISVIVDCVNTNANHEDGRYGLIEDYYTVTEPKLEGGVYSCTVEINGQKYVDHYSKELNSEHTLLLVDTTSPYVSVKLTGTATDAGYTWSVAVDSSSEVRFQAMCENVPPAQTFTVTYTDGVDSVEVFADQITENLELGAATPPFNGTPTREGYTFDGWEPEVASTVTGNATYVAQWTKNAPAKPTENDLAGIKVFVQCTNSGATHGDKRKEYGLIGTDGYYYVDNPTFLESDGKYHCTVNVNGERYVAKYSTDTGVQHTYMSVDTVYKYAYLTATWTDGGYVWSVDKDGSTVTFEARCETVPPAQTFTVTYKDGVAGKAFQDQSYTVPSGSATPAFNGTPYLAGYVFTDWTPAVATTVTANATYIATWKLDTNNNGKPDDEEERYTVTYTDGANGRAFASQVYPGLLSGTATPKFDGTPVRSGYVFIGWSPVWSGTVTGNVTYTATWSTITGGLDKVPKTGDNGLTLALSALLLFSFCGAAACVVSTKKRG